ncbi:phage tail tape measure protein [Aliiroseovarius crassostreae]|nr:phage tail tape measure protein [Aliiroseovarius crassostreae]
MDGWTGPSDKVRAAMRKVSRSAQDLRRDLGKKIRTGFTSDELEKALSRSETRITQARQRMIGAAGMAVMIGAPVIQEGNFQERLIDFANLAEIGEERIAQLRVELNALRKETGQSKLQLLDGLEAYVGKGMALDDALAGMRSTGRSAKATKSAMDEMANSGFSVMDNLGVVPGLLGKAFDVMAKSGKEGSFELGAMARKFPEITAGAKSLQMEGIDAVASLAAALQIAMKSAGSEDQAATNMTNFLGKITAPDTVKKFRKFGVDVEKEMQIAIKRGSDPLEHMLFVIEKMTGGDAFKMGQLFADKQVLDFLRALIPNMKEYQRIKGEALGADGVIDKDYEKVMKGFKEEARQLANSLSSLTGASGSLLPVVTDLMREARFGVEGLITWTNANPELTATIVQGTAALLAFSIATRAVGLGYAVLSGGVLRTAGLFFKFDKAGKNMAIFARGTRAAKWALSGFLKSGRAAKVLVGSPLKWAITPLKWTAKLIPVIPWAALAGKKLALSSMVLPLKWTAALLPSFALPLARFKAFRIGASKEITGLERHVSLKSTAMQRRLSGLKWSAAGASFMAYTNLSLIPKDPEERSDWQAKNAQSMEDFFLKMPGISHLINGQNWLRGKLGLDPMARVGDMKSTPEPTKAPTPLSAHEKLQYENELLSEINRLETQISNINNGPLSETLRQPLKVELAGLREELKGLLNPIPKAVNQGRAAPTASPRPPLRGYDSSQPNVTVESTFESQSNLDVKVQVAMPIHITREQQASNKRIAADAGKEIGAQAERAIRRRLDDGAITE